MSSWALSAAWAILRGEEVAITSMEDYEEVSRAIARIENADPSDPETHDHLCPCGGCLLDHFGKRVFRESEGGWGE